jgi:hypothetical protein
MVSFVIFIVWGWLPWNSQCGNPSQAEAAFAEGAQGLIGSGLVARWILHHQPVVIDPLSKWLIT